MVNGSLIFHGTLICHAFTLPTISEDLKTLASGLYRSFRSRYKLVSLIVFYTEGTGTGKHRFKFANFDCFSSRGQKNFFRFQLHWLDSVCWPSASTAHSRIWHKWKYCFVFHGGICRDHSEATKITWIHSTCSSTGMDYFTSSSIIELICLQDCGRKIEYSHTLESDQ